jgi:hypothetical protein
MKSLRRFGVLLRAIGCIRWDLPTFTEHLLASNPRECLGAAPRESGIRKMPRTSDSGHDAPTFWRAGQSKETTMGLFGLGAKRKPLPRPTSARPHSGMDTSQTTSTLSIAKVAGKVGFFAPVRPARLGAPMAPRAAQQADVEVSELNLDDDEFSSTFGGATTQFADTAPARLDEDPWTSRLRLD